MRSLTSIQRFAVAVGLMLFLVWLTYLSVFRIDDAYILYRYADNLAAGYGMTFNPGERVEGVSCLLWTLVLVPFSLSGLPLPWVTPVLSAASGVAVVLLVPGLSARARGGTDADVDGWDLAAAGLLAAHPSFAYWSVGALETVPYTLLLVLAARDHLRERSTGQGVRSAVWLGLATLTRPEAPLLAAAFALDRVLDDRLGRLRPLLNWGAIIGACMVSLILFRLVYFGDWLPNTYYAKTGAGLVEQARVGGLYTLSFLDTLFPGADPATGWAVAVKAVLLASCVVYGLTRRSLRFASFLCLALTAAVLLEGGDWMDLHRFYVPVLPFIAVLMVAMARALVEWITAGNVNASRALAAVFGGAAMLFIASLVVAGVRHRDGPNGLAARSEGYTHAHHAVARFLRERGTPENTVALMDVGIIGYESGLRVLDITGLTHREIARAPGRFLNKQYPVEKILEQEPRFIVLVNGFPTDSRISAHPAFESSYQLVFSRNHRFNWTPPNAYYLMVFERSR